MYNSMKRYKELVTGSRARIIIAVLWILSFVIGLIPFLGWNRKGTTCCQNVSYSQTGSAAQDNTSTTAGRDPDSATDCLKSCKLPCLFESVVDMHYMVYFNFFGCVLPPLFIMLGIYVKIFTVARKQMHEIELKCSVSSNGDSQHHGLLQREIRAAKSLSIIVGLFALCWLPVHILNCLTLFKGLYKHPLVMFTAIMLSHANSAVNPVIYAYRIQDFRNTFRKILTRYVMCQREELYLHSSNGSSRNRDQIHMTIDPLI
ncbi:adenosine receptor A2b isoform X2 [Esox lucius]|uniref:adenosine receptor A2b isoform X2 n=1 Tax=Esox lucius TaxID=8010 RepID=UPI00147761B8|nr:adenosine receptor A2b isoform X2 [Esox lucius]